MVDGSISLAGLEPLAAGKMREIFQHPSEPALLVKVISKRGWDHYAQRRRWYRPSGPIAILTRELREYRRLVRRYGSGPRHLQRIFGMAETDRGPGLLVEALRGPDGALAPTVLRLMSSGKFCQHARRAVSQFIDEAPNSPAVMRDIHCANVVVAGPEPEAYRAVVVDGFGDVAAIPVRSMFRSLNAISNRRHVARLSREVFWPAPC